MKMDVTELSMSEVDDIAERLRKLNIYASFSRMGGRALLTAAPMPACPAETDMDW